MGRDGGDVQQGQEAVGAIAAADAQHPGEAVVQEGVGQIAGAQFVRSGQISVASPATVVHHGLQSEGFHGLDGLCQALLRHRAGGVHQGDAVALMKLGNGHGRVRSFVSCMPNARSGRLP